MSTWRILLCDKYGAALQDISKNARGKQFVEQLNTPTSFTFEVDADDPKIAGLHTDGAPYLDYIRRTVKAYRLEEQFDGSELYVLRFAGHVWPTEDEGNEDDNPVTKVTCLDPLNILAFRFARTAAGSFMRVQFTNADAADVLRQLVNNTNQYAGPSGLTTSTGVFPAVGAVTVDWRLKLMSEVLSEFTSGLDVAVAPVDTTESILGVLNAYKTRGVTRDDLMLKWDAPGHTLSGVNRIMDPGDAANLLIGVGTGNSGADQLTTTVVSTDNIAAYMQLEGIESFSDVKNQAYLDQLTTAKALERMPPQQSITCAPWADALKPWTHFNTGDTGFVTAGVRLRGGILNAPVRIYGFTYGVSDEGDDTVSIVTQKSGQ